MVTINSSRSTNNLILNGTAQIDYIYGGSGNDYIYGGSNNDYLYGGLGSDYLDGGSGNDKVYGGAGDDEVYGGSGDDYLKGDAGNDKIYGGSGNDYLYGGIGDDYLNGGFGNDKYVYKFGEGNDVIKDYDGIDSLNLSTLIGKVEGIIQNGNNFEIESTIWVKNGNNLILNFDTNSKLTINNYYQTGNIENIILKEIPNEAPVFVGDKTAEINEGALYTFTSTNLNLTDSDNTPSQLTYTVSNLINGQIFINGTASNNFTQEQINNGLVRFMHNNLQTGESSFDFIVSDGKNTLDSQKFNFTVNHDNDTPLFTGDKTAEINEGALYTITNIDLNTTDIDNTSSQLVYTASNLVAGKILVNGITSNSFTQTHINNGFVKFVHNGSEAESAGFDFIVSDGTNTLDSQVFNFIINPVNDDPVFSGDKTAEINEGALYTITNTDLNLTDPDNTLDELTYTVDNLVNGQILVNGVASNSFTQAQINAGQVIFQHDDSETTNASFQFQFDDIDGSSAPIMPQIFNFTVNPVNDDPVFSGDKTATIDEGGFYILTNADLNLTDPDNTPDELSYTIDNLVNGQILVNGVASNSFTQAQINAGQVIFQHDDSETTTASFQFQFDDIDGSSAPVMPQTFNFTVNPVNDDPVFSGDKTAEINEGALYTITNTDLNLTDPDNTLDELSYTIDNLVNGQILVNGVASNSFTQAQINAGQVIFQHNGSETITASFQFQFDDIDGSSAPVMPQIFNFTVNPINDDPVFSGDKTAEINEGALYTITNTDLNLTDPDNTLDELTYTVDNLINGQILVNGVASNSFTQAQINAGQVIFQHNGSETTNASFQFQFDDIDGSSAPVMPQIFNFTVNPINDDPVFSGDKTATIDEGALYTIINTDLNLTDPDNTLDELTYTVDNLINGQILVNGVASNSFTQAQINAGQVIFQHNSSETTNASFQFQFDDIDGSSAPVMPQIFNFTVNDLPLFSGDGTIEIKENTSYIITNSDINVIDSDTPLNEINYKITTSLGSLNPILVQKWNGNEWINNDSFTQADINNGFVRLQHDGSEALTSIDFYLIFEDNFAENIQVELFNINVNQFNDVNNKAINDFLISTTNTNNQRFPEIRSLSNGNFVVAWESYDNGSDSNIRGRVFNANGTPLNASDFLISTSNIDNQQNLEIISLTNGNFVVTWESYDNYNNTSADIRGRVFNANGTAINTSDFLISTSNANLQMEPEITSLTNGNFVATWQSYDNGNDYNIRGRVFNANGTAINASDFIISTSNTYNQEEPEIRSLSNGNFVATWISFDNGNDYNIRGRIFNPNGTAVNASDFLVPTSNIYNQLKPEITSLSNGNFVATWLSSENGAYYGIKGRVFNADGTALNASEFLIPTSNFTSDPYVQCYPKITSLTNGNFVVTWGSLDNGSNCDIRGRVFNANGTPLNTSDFLVSTSNTNDQYFQEITSLSNGGFVVVWGSSDNGSNKVRGRIFNADGSALSTSDFIISTSNYYNWYEQNLEITSLLNGNFIVTWESANSTTGLDIRGRMFSADGTPLGDLTGIGTTANDLLVSQSTLKDTLIGDAGNDLYIFRDTFGNDIVKDSAGIDSMDLNDFAYSTAVFTRQEGNASTGDDLLISIGANGSILIENYFAEDSVNTAGTGYIEDIDFMGMQNVDVAHIATLGL